MPTLAVSTTVASLIVPKGAIGFVMQNESAADIRFRFNAVPSASDGVNKGLVIKAQNADGVPGEFAVQFPTPLMEDLNVTIVAGSSVNLTYEFLRYSTQR